MSHWNYRVIQRIDHGEISYAIHEAHYGVDQNTPELISENAIPVAGETVTDLYAEFKRMEEALNKPVLDYETRDEIAEEKMQCLKP